MEKLNKILSKHLRIPEEKLSDEIAYETESNWDSVIHLKMVSDIEEAFNIEFDIDEIIALETIGKIKKVVSKKVNNEPN